MILQLLLLTIMPLLALYFLNVKRECQRQNLWSLLEKYQQWKVTQLVYVSVQFRAAGIKVQCFQFMLHV